MLLNMQGYLTLSTLHCTFQEMRPQLVKYSKRRFHFVVFFQWRSVANLKTSYSGNIIRFQIPYRPLRSEIFYYFQLPPSGSVPQTGRIAICERDALHPQKFNDRKRNGQFSGYWVPLSTSLKAPQTAQLNISSKLQRPSITKFLKTASCFGI